MRRATPPPGELLDVHFFTVLNDENELAEGTYRLGRGEAGLFRKGDALDIGVGVIFGTYITVYDDERNKTYGLVSDGTIDIVRNGEAFDGPDVERSRIASRELESAFHFQIERHVCSAATGFTDNISGRYTASRNNEASTFMPGYISEVNIMETMYLDGFDSRPRPRRRCRPVVHLFHPCGAAHRHETSLQYQPIKQKETFSFFMLSGKGCHAAFLNGKKRSKIRPAGKKAKGKA